MPSGSTFGGVASKQSSGKPRQKSKLRPDIQGLRMLAVVAVILDHLLAWPSGGFVGVDVFFVISGFLITGLLLREHEASGHISFTGFYRRRVQRIIPAATLVLIATVLAAWAWFNSARYVQTAWDAVYSFFFMANWHFAAAGTDYFQASGPVSPLQHFWSLSVEEQFYFVWPWLMLGVLWLAARRGGFSRHRTLTGILMGAIVAGTFVWALFESSTNPTVAYFSTFTRAWELGLGALVAIASPWWTRIPAVARPFLGWVGLLGILASYFVINDALPFPAPWAALPVAATALVIIGGTGGEQRFLWPLTNPVSVYLGNISYSLYLWHFPIIIFAGLLIADLPMFYSVAVVLILVISAASYHLVEMPLQRAPIFQRFAGRKSQRKRARRQAWRDWRTTFAGSYKWGGSALIAFLSLSVMAIALVPPAPVQAPPSVALPVASATPGATAPAAPAFGPEVSSVQDELASALALTAWPQTDPTLDYVIENDMIPEGVGPCGDLEPPALEKCTWGDPEAPKTAVLVGDSVALAWVPALLPLYASGEWKLEIQSMYGCPFIDVQKSDEESKMEACVTRKANAIATIQEQKPDLVIVADTYILPELASTGEAVDATAWGAGLDRMLAQVAPSVAQTAVISAPPASKDVRECYTPTSSPPACVSSKTDGWSAVAKSESAAAAKNGAVFVDSSALFCVANAGCPAVAGQLPVKRDIAHITQPFAGRISPGLREILTENGVQ